MPEYIKHSTTEIVVGLSNVLSYKLSDDLQSSITMFGYGEVY